MKLSRRLFALCLALTLALTWIGASAETAKDAAISAAEGTFIDSLKLFLQNLQKQNTVVMRQNMGLERFESRHQSYEGQPYVNDTWIKGVGVDIYQHIDEEKMITVQDGEYTGIRIADYEGEDTFRRGGFNTEGVAPLLESDIVDEFFSLLGENLSDCVTESQGHTSLRVTGEDFLNAVHASVAALLADEQYGPLIEGLGLMSGVGAEAMQSLTETWDLVLPSDMVGDVNLDALLLTLDVMKVDTAAGRVSSWTGTLFDGESMLSFALNSEYRSAEGVYTFTGDLFGAEDIFSVDGTYNDRTGAVDVTVAYSWMPFDLSDVSDWDLLSYDGVSSTDDTAAYGYGELRIEGYLLENMTSLRFIDDTSTFYFNMNRENGLSFSVVGYDDFGTNLSLSYHRRGESLGLYLRMTDPYDTEALNLTIDGIGTGRPVVDFMIDDGYELITASYADGVFDMAVDDQSIHCVFTSSATEWDMTMETSGEGLFDLGSVQIHAEVDPSEDDPTLNITVSYVDFGVSVNAMTIYIGKAEPIEPEVIDERLVSWILPDGTMTEPEGIPEPEELNEYEQAILGTWSDGAHTFTFNADRTGSYDAGTGEALPFTFAATEEEISILYDGNDTPSGRAYALEGDALTIANRFGTDEFVCARVGDGEQNAPDEGAGEQTGRRGTASSMMNSVNSRRPQQPAGPEPTDMPEPTDTPEPTATPAPTPFAASPELIAEVQTRLIELGWMDGTQMTGAYDSATSLAVLDFQRYINSKYPDAQLPEDGNADVNTVNWLTWIGAPERPASLTYAEPTEEPEPEPTAKPGESQAGRRDAASNMMNSVNSRRPETAQRPASPEPTDELWQYPTEEPPQSDMAALEGEWVSESGQYAYTFNADGTGSYVMMSLATLDFTYTATDTELSIVYEGVDAGMTLSYELEGDTLVVLDAAGGSVTYVRR
ncbi:MAG: hypothetical protein IJJ23_08155 [Clostridia bacterium]|nr:hypothetical protein [Clostridia bacterium]